MQFEWDENKNKINIEKHNIDFNYAKEISYENLL
ncbi:MAG: BrnT family toxin [Bacteroidia bacterium]|nr:BrnT family toxin [Bacteroidia bacterium]